MQSIAIKETKGTLVLEIGDEVFNSDVGFSGFIEEIDPNGEVKVVGDDGETRWFDAVQLEV